MTTLTLVAKPISQMQFAPGSAVAISNVHWQEFESILEELGQKRRARVAYSNGTLEIMVPLPKHEIPSDLISDIVKTLLKSTGRRYQPFGATTFKREGRAGVEPDTSFYIENYRQMIGRRRLEPGDPPPDLAIETDVTSKTKMEAYLAISVPEVWVYDREKLTIYLLSNGEYIQSNVSPTFPQIAITQIVPTAVARSWVVGNLQALEELEVAIAQSRS